MISERHIAFIANRVEEASNSEDLELLEMELRHLCVMYKIYLAETGQIDILKALDFSGIFDKAIKKHVLSRWINKVRKMFVETE